VLRIIIAIVKNGNVLVGLSSLYGITRYRLYQFRDNKLYGEKTRLSK